MGEVLYVRESLDLGFEKRSEGFKHSGARESKMYWLSL